MDAIRRDILCAVLPFAAWIALQSLLPAAAWAYAVRTVVTAVVGVLCLRGRGLRPDCRLAPFAAGLVVGMLVCALWVLPERFAAYRTWCCWPIGSLATVPAASPYDPHVCGWPLTVVKLIGSAFVIAPVEEVFFRSFLYRWLQRHDFTAVPLSHFDLSAFLWTVLLFTLEHDRPFAAAMAGVLYGLAALRWGLGAAIVAHVTTNLALGLHVICRGDWAFW